MAKNNFFDIRKKSEIPQSALEEKGSSNWSSKSILFSRGKISTEFFTEDSKKYITPRQQILIEKGIVPDMRFNKWDSLSSRIIRQYNAYQPKKNTQKNILFEKLKKRYEIIENQFSDASQGFIGQFSLVRLWNFSIVGAILLGMFSMTLIYKYLGAGASAQGRDIASAQNAAIVAPQVLGDETEKNPQLKQAVQTVKETIEEKNKREQQEFEDKLSKMVKGYPIESMVPMIAKKDKKVAAFLIGIAKKESAWGKRKPVLNGVDCKNYWGYRSQRQLMGSGGHTCFNSTQDAVDTVAKRIETFVEDKKLDTPEKMIIWKCGSNCDVKNNADERKWISDVKMYYEEALSQ